MKAAGVGWAWPCLSTHRPVSEAHGWGEVTSELRTLLARGDTDGMTALITDDMLDVFSVTATGDGLTAALAGRYGGLVDRVGPYGTDLRPPETRDRWHHVTAALRGA